MNINIKATNIELNTEIKDYVDSKILSLDKFLNSGNDIPVFLEIGRESNHHQNGPDVFMAEIHFSFEGNQVVLNTILSQARLDPVPSFAMVDGIAGISDLSLHLLGRPMKEQGQIGENATHFFGGSEVQLEIVNDTSQHVGTHYVWRNAKAINKLKVIAFGNSFFDRGTSISCLSWWLARLFSEFHFIWSPDMDFEYINKVKPDLVIGQTIERFLVHPANT